MNDKHNMYCEFCTRSEGCPYISDVNKSRDLLKGIENVTQEQSPVCVMVHCEGFSSSPLDYLN